MSNKWQPDFDAYFQYNMMDVRTTVRVHQIFYESCRRELMPRFGSAWENMMDYYYNRPKEAKNAQIR